MRYLFILLVLGLTSLFASLDWFEGSYDAALEKAEKEQKLVMVMLTREGCDACWYMENIVFDDDNVYDEVQMDFIPFQVDIHNDFIPEGMSYIGTPTFYFMSADGKKLDRLNGGANVKEFTDFMREVKKSVKK